MAIDGKTTRRAHGGAPALNLVSAKAARRRCPLCVPCPGGSSRRCASPPSLARQVAMGGGGCPVKPLICLTSPDPLRPADAGRGQRYRRDFGLQTGQEWRSSGSRRRCASALAGRAIVPEGGVAVPLGRRRQRCRTIRASVPPRSRVRGTGHGGGVNAGRRSGADHKNPFPRGLRAKGGLHPWPRKPGGHPGSPGIRGQMPGPEPPSGRQAA